jgi:hypothetical protein
MHPGRGSNTSADHCGCMLLDLGAAALAARLGPLDPSTNRSARDLGDT